ncbi:MAG: hypothetical protein RL226_2353 [Bacteroidota bacterium]|jgi:copper chaperone CopZ
MKNILVLSLLLLAFSATAQKTQTATFWVGGVCEMCEERIENALDVKGVKVADYNLQTHKVTVTFNSKKISEDKLHALLNAAGHDTEKSKASDEAYDRVHGCCKYRDPEVQKAHQHGEEDGHDHDHDDDDHHE